MKKALLFCGALLIFAASCKKDNDDTKTKKDYLTTGNWFVRASTYTISYMGIDSTYDSFADMEACEKDNFVTFNADGTYVSDEGATKCDPSDPQSTSGTWMLIDNDSKLVITENTFSDTTNVAELNGSTLKIETSESIMGASYKYTITMGH